MNKPKPSNSPSYLWQELIQLELKNNSNLGRAFEKAGFGGCENRTLTLYLEDDALAKTARGQIEPLKKKLSGSLSCDRVDIKIGKVPQKTIVTTTPTSGKSLVVKNPLQSLNFAEFGLDRNGSELSQPVLIAAVDAEKTNTTLYTQLEQRTKSLIGKNGDTISATFNWRLRVGGTRGFRELLLPVFHPVFGVPYIPASSLKGAARAWARNHATSEEINQILGMLQGSTAKAAKVEFLDAFPLKPCLSVDVATPQWHWQGDKVRYKPEPHPLLSMEQPAFLIGLRPTKPEYVKDVALVKEWLENALKVGIGSRVSSGYGKALGSIPTFPHHKSFKFEFWTQGLYGSEPPSRENRWQGKSEFRPTAIRGILRYWFRSIAMNLYQPDRVKQLEDEIFGQLSKQGGANISVRFNPSARQDPYFYDGRIIIEGREQKYMDLLEQILIFAAHLGGFGRGSRRPLHLLNDRMRGCHWSIDGNTLPLEYSLEGWKSSIDRVQLAFKAIEPHTGNYNVSPGDSKPRYQDVLDNNAQIWLVKSPGQIAPKQVNNWREEGNRDNVRGKALTLLYGDARFKGEKDLKDSQGKKIGSIGNRYVGGALEIPSFVWIKSIFPRPGDPYQVVTIFGVNQNDRLIFAKELEKLANQNPAQAILVCGTMPSDRSTDRSNRPIRR